MPEGNCFETIPISGSCVLPTTSWPFFLVVDWSMQYMLVSCPGLLALAQLALRLSVS